MRRNAIGVEILPEYHAMMVKEIEPVKQFLF
jgi:hypothetical protein